MGKLPGPGFLIVACGLLAERCGEGPSRCACLLRSGQRPCHSEVHNIYLLSPLYAVAPIVGLKPHLHGASCIQGKKNLRVLLTDLHDAVAHREHKSLQLGVDLKL